ncbi:MAG: 2-dehydropantoate 2-reductase, partial [Pseudomonadota bacterium]|nr:2-dehydropantoate 2-reductase [Pseudomonadota bacterium]
GVVLTLQNGLGIEADLAAIVGAQRVMGGLCFLCAQKMAPGHICHLDYGTITLGDYAPGYTAVGISERMQQIAADWERAGLNMQLTEDLLLTRWKKLIWNIPFNGLSVVLNATTAEMIADDAIRSLVRQIMQEVVCAAAQCSQRQIPDSFIDKMLTDTAKMKSYKTSMKLDYEHSRPLELESILARPLQLAAQVGLELPRITMLYNQLLFLTQHRN